METRYAKLTELRQIARYMRARECGILSTSIAVISFARHGGKILLTLDDDNEIKGVFAFVSVDENVVTEREQHLLVQAILVEDSTCVEVTDSLRLAIRAVLSVTKSAYAMTSMMSGGHECEGMMLALGFLHEDAGAGCRVYVCCNSDVHHGGVILERILCGKCETLVEV